MNCRYPFWALALICAVGAPVAAETPRSAIPWLSESLKSESLRDWNSADPQGTDALESDIETSSLGIPSLDGMGILTPVQTGFAEDLWGKTSAEQVGNLVLTQQSGGVPAARAAFLRVLLAETKPPLGAGDPPTALLARIDRLMELGALDPAEALLAHTGFENPDLFRRAFDVAILTERTSEVCDSLRSTPSLSPTLPARIFCLARSGDWHTAEITLSLGSEIGEISEEKQEILGWFLDPQLFEGEENPALPEPLTALDFVLRDAVALPRPSGHLPLAFLHIDVSEDAPMRARIEAGERLVRAGVIAPSVLFHAYRSGKPAASGGIWDRAAAVQQLDKALIEGEAEAIGEALQNADHRLSDHGLRLALSKTYASALSELDAGRFSRATTKIVFELLLLAGENQAAMNWHIADQDPKHQLLLHLIDRDAQAPEISRLNNLEQAVLAGLDIEQWDSPEADYLIKMAESGQMGTALLKTLTMLNDGLEIEPGDLSTALYVLAKIGLRQTAQRVALETLLLQQRA